MASIGISDVVTFSAYSEITLMKKLMKMIFGEREERTKRARHSQVCTIENRDIILWYKQFQSIARACHTLSHFDRKLSESYFVEL